MILMLLGPLEIALLVSKKLVVSFDNANQVSTVGPGRFKEAHPYALLDTVLMVVNPKTRSMAVSIVAKRSDLGCLQGDW